MEITGGIMKCIDITVIVCTYNAEREALRRTMDSIVCQTGCEWDIVVTDDGSFTRQDNLLNHYKELLKEKLTIMNHTTNMGTVSNLLSSLRVSKGKYVKPLGQGDYLTSDAALTGMVRFMEENNYAAAFSDMTLFQFDADGKQVFIRNHIPLDVKCYLKRNRKQVMSNMFYNFEFLCGASLWYQKDLLEKYLGEIVGKIRYCEDFVTQLLVLEGYEIGFCKECLVAYESSGGLSTSQTERLKTDHVSMDLLLGARYPGNPYVKFRLFHRRMTSSRFALVRKLRFFYRMWKAPDCIRFYYLKNAGRRRILR